MIDDVPDGVNIYDFGVKKIRYGLVPLIKYLGSQNPDAILVAMWPLTIITILAKIISKTKSTLVISEHTTLTRTPIAKGLIHIILLKLTIKYIYPFADNIVAPAVRCA